LQSWPHDHLAHLPLLAWQKDFVPIVVGNVVMCYGLGLAWAGAREFRGGAPSFAIVHAAAVLVGVASILFSVVVAHVPSRLVSVSLVGALFMAAGGRVMIDHPPLHLREPMRVAAVAFFTMAVLLSLRIVGVLALDAPGSSVEPTALNSATYLAGTVCVLAVYLAALICANGQVLHDVNRLLAEDEMTGALSRRGFYLGAPSWIRHHQDRAAALIIDLDHFKQVNDQLGHAQGDALLKLFVTTAQGTLPEDALLARVGGDEFVALLPDNTQTKLVASQLRERFEEAARHMFADRLKGRMPTITIGTSSLGADLSETLHRADAALYAAKEAGRNRVAAATQQFGGRASGARV
jgi:diguanylate cyclase (GGDEF)-like protein